MLILDGAFDDVMKTLGQASPWHRIFAGDLEMGGSQDEKTYEGSGQFPGFVGIVQCDMVAEYPQVLPDLTPLGAVQGPPRRSTVRTPNLC